MAKKKTISHQQMNGMNWRYKSKQPPQDSSNGMNGPVKVTKPSTIKKPSKRLPKAYRANYHNDLSHLRSIMGED